MVYFLFGKMINQLPFLYLKKKQMDSLLQPFESGQLLFEMAPQEGGVRLALAEKTLIDCLSKGDLIALRRLQKQFPQWNSCQLSNPKTFLAVSLSSVSRVEMIHTVLQKLNPKEIEEVIPQVNRLLKDLS